MNLNHAHKLYYLHDSKIFVNLRNAKLVDNIDDFYDEIMKLEKNDPIFDSESLFFIDLGVMDDLVVKKPIEISHEELEKIIDETEISDDVDEENIVPNVRIRQSAGRTAYSASSSLLYPG